MVQLSNIKRKVVMCKHQIPVPKNGLVRDIKKNFLEDGVVAYQMKFIKSTSHLFDSSDLEMDLVI